MISIVRKSLNLCTETSQQIIRNENATDLIPDIKTRPYRQKADLMA